LSHLRAERRLSPKTLEAYSRDVRQCLVFLAEHWGARVTLVGFGALEASDIRAFMAMRRADEIGGRSLMRALAGCARSAAFLERRRQGQGRRVVGDSRAQDRQEPAETDPYHGGENAGRCRTSAPVRPARAGSWRAMPP